MAQTQIPTEPETKPHPSEHEGAFKPDSDATQGIDWSGYEGNATIDDLHKSYAEPPKPAPKPKEPTPATPADEPASRLAEDTDAEPAKPESKVPELDVPATIKSPKAADDFRKIKKERDDLAKQLEELKQKPSTPANDDAVTALTKERDDLSRQLMILDVERHPKFQEYFDGGINRALELAKKIVGGDKGERVATLLKMEDSEWRNTQLNEILEDLPPVKQSHLGSVLYEVSKLQLERSNEITKAHENRERIMRMNEENQNRTRQQLDSVFSEVIADAASKSPLFQNQDGKAEHNEAVKQRLELAKAVYHGNLEPQDKARAALWAAAGPEWLRELAAVSKERDELKAKLAGIEEADPEPGNGSLGKPANEADKNLSYVDAVEKGFREEIGEKW